MSLLKTAFQAALLSTGHIVPAAGRLGNAMRAAELFNRAGPGGKALIPFIERRLKWAGYDTATDKPYISVLKLKGGREEFLRILNGPN